MDNRLKEYLERRKISIQRLINKKEEEKLNCRPTQVRVIAFEIAQLEAAYDELLLVEKNMSNQTQ
jgi:hypothetical protein